MIQPTGSIRRALIRAKSQHPCLAHEPPCGAETGLLAGLLPNANDGAMEEWRRLTPWFTAARVRQQAFGGTQ